MFPFDIFQAAQRTSHCLSNHIPLEGGVEPCDFLFIQNKHSILFTDYVLPYLRELLFQEGGIASQGINGAEQGLIYTWVVASE
jgi:hypothetical protein